MITRLSVFHRDFEDMPIGHLELSKTGAAVFCYNPPFLRKRKNPFPPQSGVQFRLGPQVASFRSGGLTLHGAFAECLPDSWGMRVLHASFRQAELKPSLLDYLSVTGQHNCGEIFFEPALKNRVSANVDLEHILKEARHFYEGQTKTVIAQLVQAAGKAGGGRPKVSLYFSEDFTECSTAAHKDWESWIVKVPCLSDFPGALKVEKAYMQMGAACGLEVAETRLLDSEAGQCLMIRRFDYSPGLGYKSRYTVANAFEQDIDPRFNGWDAETLLLKTQQLCKRDDHLLNMYRHLVFNALAYNCDDHLKNFSFMLRDGKHWEVSPAYDRHGLL